MRFALEWLDLVLRWTHVFAGILWVGTTYYFTWVGRRLGEEAAGVSIVHGGAFYTVRKQAAPPERLHWFRWEALTTWLSGLALLWIVYYLRSRGVGVGGLSALAAFGVAVAFLVFAWIVYDLLWISPLARFETPLIALCYLILVALSFALMQVFNGRAAYIHVGSLMGTLMTANVWLRIVPAYRRILESARTRGPLDEALVARAQLRSKHNAFLAMPTVLTMISNHYPASTYGSQHAWLVLSVLILVGWAAAKVIRDH
jgi:uncharacterized membrane protein